MLYLLMAKSVLLIPVMALGSNTMPAQEFNIDNTHSSCVFSISHFNIGYIYGRFNKVAGNVVLDTTAPNNSKFAFSIDAQSIDTNDPGRDTHLKSNEFLKVDEFPTIEFKSTSVQRKEDVFHATGVITICGVRKEITIPLQLLGVGKGPFGDVRVGMLGKFTIKRSEFGVDKMLDGIGDKVAVTFSFEGIRK